MGKREVNKGKIKLAILEETLELMKDKTFDRINVIDICHRVGISEVTFFKYFKRKEEILQFYMLVWDYKRSYRLESEGTQRGLAGIYAIFRDIAQTDNVLGIMTSFISFIAKQREKPDSIMLETFDKEIILQEKVPSKAYDDLDAQIFRRIQEAVEDGEICKDISVEDLHRVLSGLFYGVPLITHAMAGADLSGDYQNALNYVFAGIIVKRSDENGDR